MEKMPKIVLLISLHLTSQSIETYGKINLAGMCSHPINANRLRCQTKPIWVLLTQSATTRTTTATKFLLGPLRFARGQKDIRITFKKKIFTEFELPALFFVAT